jgi:hypothetical protein
MLGYFLTDVYRAYHSCSPYTCPVLAGVGVSTTVALAVVDWSRLTGQATAALALAGLVGGTIVGGVVYAVNKYDQVRISRQKLYDDANKASISAQMAESLANQEKMRTTLHALANEAQVAKGENHLLRDDLATLRQQFMVVSKQLHETDQLLHAARVEMHEASVKLHQTTVLLAATEADRNALRDELRTIRSTQATQSVRIGVLEKGGSGDSIPAFGRVTAANTKAVDANTKAVGENTKAVEGAEEPR